MTVTSMF